MRLALDDGAAGLGAVVVLVTAGRRSARWLAVADHAALVRTVCAVVDPRAAVAAVSAAAKIGVELLQQPCRDLSYRLVAQGGSDVQPEVRLVALPRGRIDLVDLQPFLDRRPQRALRAGMPLGVDLGK